MIPLLDIIPYSNNRQINNNIISFIIYRDTIYKILSLTITNESSYKLHIAYIENDLKLNVKVAKYVQLLVRYFHDIYNNILKNTIEHNISKIIHWSF